MKVGISEIADKGIFLCKKGQWDEGLTSLARVLLHHPDDFENTTVYSYYGFGIALKEGRIQEGLDFCEKAVELGFFVGDNYMNLARTHILKKDRGAAFRAVEKGLEVQPNHTGLIAMRKKFGFRKRPVLPFVSRDNPANQVLGKLRHSITGGRGKNPAAATKPDGP